MTFGIGRRCAPSRMLRAADRAESCLGIVATTSSPAGVTRSGRQPRPMIAMQSSIRSFMLTALTVIVAVLGAPVHAQAWDPRWGDIVADSNAMILEVEPSAAQRERIHEIVRDEFERDPAGITQQLSQLADGMRQMQALPAETRRLALGATRLDFLRKSERDAAAGDALSRLSLEMYRAAHPPIDAGAPLFSAQVADAFIDAFLFHGEITSGEPAPALGDAGRQQLRRELAADYARAADEVRQQMIESMARITTHRIQWPDLDELQRLSVRAELGGRLSIEEQQLLQQYRHMVSDHGTRMLVNELNFMRDMQQTIMGSAPYWNPSSQSWEQKGGIVTEFR